MRSTVAAMIPMRIALLRWSLGRPAAASPITMALSPARTRSIMTTWRNAVIASAEKTSLTGHLFDGSEPESVDGPEPARRGGQRGRPVVQARTVQCERFQSDITAPRSRQRGPAWLRPLSKRKGASDQETAAADGTILPTGPPSTG